MSVTTEMHREEVENGQGLEGATCPSRGVESNDLRLVRHGYVISLEKRVCRLEDCLAKRVYRLEENNRYKEDELDDLDRRISDLREAISRENWVVGSGQYRQEIGKRRGWKRARVRDQGRKRSRRSSKRLQRPS